MRNPFGVRRIKIELGLKSSFAEQRSVSETVVAEEKQIDFGLKRCITQEICQTGRDAAAVAGDRHNI